MVLIIGEFYQHQLFQGLVMMIILSVIYSKPYGKIGEQNLEDLKKENSVIDVERQKIITELKSKILSRLNLDSPPQNDKAFSWRDIPEEMTDLFHKEVRAESRKTRKQDKKRVETIMSTLIKATSCQHNQSIKRECFNVTIPNLDFKELISVKLLAPIKSDVETAFNNIVEYNITINQQYKIGYNLKVGTHESGNLEFDLLDVYKEMLSDDDNLGKENNGKSLFIYIDGRSSSPDIEQVIELNEIILEIRYSPLDVLKRSKRSENMCVPHRYFCCTQNMTVRVEELGWKNFIVAPLKFVINYCKGDCNNYLENSSNHMKALNLLSPTGSIEVRDSRACCVPYSFSSVTIMIINNQSALQVTTLNDLVASSCGCL